MKIYSSNDILIKRDNNNYELSFNNTNNYKNFWKNTVSQIEPLKKHITKEKSTIYFKAHNIKTLSQLLKEKNNQLSYRHALLLFLCIGDQIRYLEKDKHSILVYNLNDIVIISSDKEQYDVIFLLLNTSHFFPINNEKFNINIPFPKKNNFLSPELKKVNSLPFSINYKSTYYSIALLIASCLNSDILKSKSIFEELKTELNLIQDSKLFYALLRCLDDKPENRYYLYI
jgi:hypothetical protein